MSAGDRLRQVGWGKDKEISVQRKCPEGYAAVQEEEAQEGSSYRESFTRITRGVMRKNLEEHSDFQETRTKRTWELVKYTSLAHLQGQLSPNIRVGAWECVLSFPRVSDSRT